MKCNVKIELEIDIDELQYESDGFISLKNVKEAFTDQFSGNASNKYKTGYDMEYTLYNVNIDVVSTE